MRQNRAPQAVQHVGLILVRVGGPMQFRLAVARGTMLGVMAGGDEIGFELLAVGPQLAELQPVVADDARIRRAAGQVFVGEIVDDAVEVALEIEGVKRDVEPVGDAAGIAGIDGAAAALLVIGAAVVARRGRRCA